MNSANWMRSLPPQEIHIWECRIGETREHHTDFWRSLNSSEIHRASKFHSEAQRLQFVIGRGGLRHLLAEYVGGSASQFEFAYNEFGKPYIATAQHDITFNLSHSGDMCLWCFGRLRPVGIDVEQLSPNLQYEELLRWVFSPEERINLQSLDENEQRRAFYHSWTKREAYLKARGVGLSAVQDGLGIVKTPPIDEVVDADWTCYSFWPDPAYSAAIVTRGAVRLRTYALRTPFGQKESLPFVPG